jgi:hypothetical protein
MTEMTKLKLDTTHRTQLSDNLSKPLFSELTPSSNMIHLMKNANNFLPDKRKLLLLPLREKSFHHKTRENAEPD